MVITVQVSGITGLVVLIVILHALRQAFQYTLGGFLFFVPRHALVIE